MICKKIIYTIKLKDKPWIKENESVIKIEWEQVEVESSSHKNASYTIGIW